MRVLFYIFLISQLLNFSDIFAEKIREESLRSNSVKWEKVKGGKSNLLKKIFWKSYKDDDSNFKEFNKDDVLSEKNKNPFDENKFLKFGGLTVDNSVLLERGESHINIDYDSSGNLFSSYSYSLSNIFQLNLMNVGSFKTKNVAIKKNSQFTNIFLGDNNINYRVGGKLLIFSPEKNDLIWLSSRVSLGTELNSKQSYIYSDLTTTFKLNNLINFNINPKYLFGEVGNIGAIGLSNNVNFSEKIQFIGETNLGITQNSSSNLTFALSYTYSPSKSINIFATNAAGFQDIGTMLSSNDYKFGIRINYIF